MTPFVPVGVEAKWRPVYRHLATLSVGDVVTYETVAELADSTLERMGSHFRRARRELEREHLRTLDNVREVGYRVVEANEHPRLVAAQMRASSRRLRRGLQIGKATNRNELSPEAEARLDAQENRIVALEALAHRHEDRLTGIERRLARVEKRTAS